MSTNSLFDKGFHCRMRFDHILTHLGDFGTYQKRVYFLVCIPIIFSAFHKLVWVFLGAVPPHRCLLPEDDSLHPIYDIPGGVLNQTIPWDAVNLRWSHCEMYTKNQTDASLHQDAWPTSQCEQIIFDHSQYETTVVTEYDLVCGRTWLRPMAHSLYSVGEMIGGITIGSAADRIGRKKILFTCLIGITVSGVLAGIVPNLYAFFAFRILVGICAQAIILSAFVLGLEFVGPSKRVFAGIFCNYYFALAYLIMAAFAYWIRKWEYLQIAISIPSAILCICLRWIPESARWLISVNRSEEAVAIIRKAARINKVKLPPLSIENTSLETKTQRPATYSDLLRNSSIRKTVLVVSYGWLVNSAVYYGLSLNTSNLGGNDYLNFLIAALVEFPAYTLCLFTMDIVGRRFLICTCMVIGGLCLMTTIFIPIDMTTLTIIMAMLGKFGISASYGVIFVMAAELYPTGIRNAALGINSFSSRIGSIFTSFIVSLADYWKPLPLIVLGAMSCSSGALILFLPETKGKDMPETLEDAEKIFRKRRESISAVAKTKFKELEILTASEEKGKGNEYS